MSAADRSRLDNFMDVGEHWAYRASVKDPLTEVRVESVGKKRPPRVKVSFLDDAAEGAVDWVPAARLKVLWADRKALQQSEARWEDVERDGRPPSPERDAAWSVLMVTVPGIADLHAGGAMGIGEISDVSALTAILGRDARQLAEEPGAFQENDALLVPWSVTRQIAIDLVARSPGPVLSYIRERVDAHLANARARADARPAWEFNQHGDRFVEYASEPPFDHAELEVLRAWCGVENLSLESENQLLRERVQRLASLGLTAGPELRRVRTHKATRLALELEEAATESLRPLTDG